MQSPEQLEKDVNTENQESDALEIVTDEENLVNDHALKKVTIGIYF